jgi:hypothetical protein
MCVGEQSETIEFKEPVEPGILQQLSCAGLLPQVSKDKPMPASTKSK